MRVEGIVINYELIKEIAKEMGVKDLRHFEFYFEDNINRAIELIAEEFNDQEARK